MLFRDVRASCCALLSGGVVDPETPEGLPATAWVGEEESEGDAALSISAMSIRQDWPRSRAGSRKEVNVKKTCLRQVFYGEEGRGWIEGLSERERARRRSTLHPLLCCDGVGKPPGGGGDGTGRSRAGRGVREAVVASPSRVCEGKRMRSRRRRKIGNDEKVVKEDKETGGERREERGRREEEERKKRGRGEAERKRRGREEEERKSGRGEEGRRQETGEERKGGGRREERGLAKDGDLIGSAGGVAFAVG
eukprot:762429-Hanusia_phi.AAC.3